jgi:monothiol glutaredoxin
MFPVICRRISTSSVLFRQKPILSNIRYFSDDSHDDFKKVLKKEPDGMDNVMKLIDQQVKENPIMLYMKGTPSKPQCGFSMQAVRILNALGADFSSVNVLDNPGIREGIKAYA